MKQKDYRNPYVAGVLLGILLVITIYISGHGLGASGAAKSAVIFTMEKVAPSHTESLPYMESYNKTHSGNPLKSWLVFEILGALLGAFISGMISNRSKFQIEKPKWVTSKQRIIAAIIGGSLFGFGSQLGRGCTSGAALTGMAVFSTGGMLTMVAIFGGGYIFAYAFRKLWIN
jgi:uncharacterized membrane protein YedE/YeeE